MLPELSSSVKAKRVTIQEHPDGIARTEGAKSAHTIELWDFREQALALA